MAHVFVAKNGAGQVAHDLMNIDQDTPGSIRIKGDRLHVRVNLAPLLRPVSADFFGPTDKTAFKRFRPGYVRGHGGKGGVDVPRVEGRVGGSEQLDFRGKWSGHKRSGEDERYRWGPSGWVGSFISAVAIRIPPIPEATALDHSDRSNSYRLLRVAQIQPLVLQ